MRRFSILTQREQDGITDFQIFFDIVTSPFVVSLCALQEAFTMNLPGASTRRRRRLPSIDDAVDDDIDPCDVSVDSSDISSVHLYEYPATRATTTAAGESTHEGSKKRKRTSASKVASVRVLSDDDQPNTLRRDNPASKLRAVPGEEPFDNRMEEESDQEVVILGTRLISEASARHSPCAVQRPLRRNRLRLSHAGGFRDNIPLPTHSHRTRNQLVRSAMQEQERKQQSFSDQIRTSSQYLRKTRNGNKIRDLKVDNVRPIRGRTRTLLLEKPVSKSRDDAFKSAQLMQKSPSASSSTGSAIRREACHTRFPRNGRRLSEFKESSFSEQLDGSDVRGFPRMKNLPSIDKRKYSNVASSVGSLETNDDVDSDWSDLGTTSKLVKLARGSTSRHRNKPLGKNEEDTDDNDSPTRRHALEKHEAHKGTRATKRHAPNTMEKETMSVIQRLGKLERPPSNIEMKSIGFGFKATYQRVITETETHGFRDATEIVYEIALSKLRKIDLKSSVKFCQLYLVDCYAKAKELSSYIEFVEEDKGKSKALVAVRETIAGVWCAFARMLLTLADEILTGTDGERGRRTLLGHLDKDQLKQLGVSLLDFSLMLLSKAATCSLVGNHAWIALSYSRIAQFASRLANYDCCNQLQNRHRSLKVALSLCRQVLGEQISGIDADAEPCSDQAVLDRLDKFEIFDISATVSLWQQMSSPIAGDILFRDDEATPLLVTREIDQLVFRQKGDDHVTQEAPHWMRADRALSRLLVPVGRTCISRSRIRETSVHAVSNEATYFDVEYLSEDTHLKISQIIPLERRRTMKRTSVPMHGTTKVRDGCHNIVYFCPTCSTSAAFASEESLVVHCRACKPRLAQATVVCCAEQNPAMRFGTCDLVGDWSKRSFDPQNGPFLSHDDLLDVLSYSVEIFEASEEDILDSSSDGKSYTLSAPYYVGQVGLRCQHCRNALGGYCDAPGSFVFPKNVENLAHVMWFLSLTHLDNCVNQPRCVHAWHQEYRRQVSFTSFLPADYWENVAKDFNLVSDTCGGVVFGKH